MNKAATVGLFLKMLLVAKKALKSLAESDQLIISAIFDQEVITNSKYFSQLFIT